MNNEREQLNYYKEKCRILSRKINNYEYFHKKKMSELRKEHVDSLAKSYSVLTVFTDVLNKFIENSNITFMDEYYTFYDRVLNELDKKIRYEYGLRVVIEYPDPFSTDSLGRDFHLLVVPDEGDYHEG